MAENYLTSMKRLLLIWLLLVAPWFVHAQEAKATLPGVLEHWSYNKGTGELTLRGWVLGGKDGKSPPTIKLAVAESQFQVQEIPWEKRPDISSDNPLTGGQVGLGFSWTVSLSKDLPGGVYPIKLDAIYGDKKPAALLSASTPMIVVEKVRGRHWWVLGIVLVALACIQFSKPSRGQRLGKWLQERRAYLVIAGLWAALVAIGITGSSIGLLIHSPYGQSMLDAKGSNAKLFSLRSIRADEWSVLMPNVLAQIHHEPPFPVVNSNIGPNGQNMGVIGMTGAPVKQWAALARPATWGYFFLPMRQALSWQWQMPFWGGLLSIWFLLNLLRPDRKGLNFGLAFSFCVAPYAAAWSNWPLYAAMFPALAFVLSFKIMKIESPWKTALMGAILGWLLACWALVLYPPWIIIGGSFLLLLAVGWGFDQRSELRWGWAQLLGIFAALAVASALLGSWWLDTRDAVALMQATEYPGKRGSMPGGDLAWWWHLRGYSNADTVVRSPGPETNQSEISSYFILPILMVALCAVHLMRSTKYRWSVAACAAFMICYWIFSFSGFPIWLAKYSLWGNMPTARIDLGMGLAFSVLMALVAGGAVATVDKDGNGKSVSIFQKWLIPGLVAISSAGLIAWTLMKIPKDFTPSGSWVYTLAMTLSGAAICWWIMRRRMAAGVAMLVIVNLLATLAFNPVTKAPKDVILADGNLQFLKDPHDENKRLRTLALNGDGVGPLMLAGMGYPVANGVLYYPHKEFWEKMGLPESKWPIVNRYQHLGFYVDETVNAGAGYTVSAPAVDYIRVLVNPKDFDFNKTGADRVVVLADEASGLNLNSSLIWLGAFRSFHWFAVKGRPAE